jgi:sigma-B regulation protein RsbU (phosphoserine phosphatase)
MREVAPPPKPRRTVGFLTIESSTPYQSALIAALAAACEERDVNLVVFTEAYLERDGGHDACRLFAAKLAGSHNVDAMIVPVLGNVASLDMVAAFVARFQPLPVCTVSLTIPGYPNVQIDNEAGFHGLVRHLVEVHRYRRFVFLARPPEHVEGRVRRRAYADKLASYGIEPLADIVVPGDPILDPEIITRALAQVGKVDAIVAVDDYLVPSLLRVLETLGLRVPADVAVTGFDDSDIARGANPPLTSVRQPFYAMLDSALTSVLASLDGREVAPETLIAPELVCRRSCGCLSEGMSLYPTDPREGSSLVTDLAGARAAVIEEWQEIPGLRILPGAWENSLYAAFVADLLGGSREAGSRLTECLAQHCAKGGEVQAWNPVVSTLKRHLLPLTAADPLVMARAETMIQRLRTQLGGAEAGRAHGQRLRSEVLARQHAVVADRLLRNLNREHLIASLPELFTQLGVDTFWFSTFPDPEAPETGARLASAMVHGQPVDVAAYQDNFPPVHLVPESQRPSDECYAWVVSPVHDEERQLGLLVCSYLRDHGVTYEIMALQIGAALHGAWLVERIEEETERRERAERERLVRELELAERIQTSILPRHPQVPGLDIATVMLPATEVGGDYFDVLPMVDGCMMGIGDVAGHGLNTGLVMLMLQSAVSTAVALKPDLTPTDAYLAVNRVLYENIRNRLLQDEHVTLALIRYRTNGHLTIAGAHDDILIFRARTGEVEIVTLTGFWAGAIADVAELTVDQYMQLEPGDVVLLYTDGSTEAMDAQRQLFGRDRLAREFAQVGRKPVTEIRDQLLAAVQRWLHHQEDDIAFLVARYVGLP